MLLQKKNLGPGALQAFHELRGPVKGTSSQLVDFVQSVQFSILLPTDFGTRGDTNARGTLGSGYGDLVKNHRFALFWPVSMLLLTDSGSRGDTNVPRTTGTS